MFYKVRFKHVQQFLRNACLFVFVSFILSQTFAVSDYYSIKTPLQYIRNLITRPFFIVAGLLEVTLVTML